HSTGLLPKHPTEKAADATSIVATDRKRGIVLFAAVHMSASLIGRLGQALSGYPPLQCRCRSRARASLRTRHQGPCMGLFESSRVTHFFHRRVLGSISPGLILTASSAMMQSG